MRKRHLLAGLVALAACSGSDDEGLVVPIVGSDFALFATAPAGRGIDVANVRVIRVAEIETLALDPIPGVTWMSCSPA